MKDFSHQQIINGTQAKEGENATTPRNEHDHLLTGGENNMYQQPATLRLVGEEEGTISNHFASYDNAEKEEEGVKKKKESAKLRDLIAFFICGLMNNYSYVVMLSAAGMNLMMIYYN